MSPARNGDLVHVFIYLTCLPYLPAPSRHRFPLFEAFNSHFLDRSNRDTRIGIPAVLDYVDRFTLALET